jgi:hypothetical protein
MTAEVGGFGEQCYPCLRTSRYLSPRPLTSFCGTTARRETAGRYRFKRCEALEALENEVFRRLHAYRPHMSRTFSRERADEEVPVYVVQLTVTDTATNALRERIALANTQDPIRSDLPDTEGGVPIPM